MKFVYITYCFLSN